MSRAFYRTWRPAQWEEVIGQEHVIHTLQNAVRTDRVGHAYLFAGPRGTGKTTTARLLAKAVNCLEADPGKRPCNQCEFCTAVNENRFLDLIEIDAASNTSVEDVRDLRDKINFSPNQGKYKVYIIDEVHMLSTAAFNALLKTLEEPPAHAIFILATTEVHKIPPTVLSRCQRHEFRKISNNQIAQYLGVMAQREGIQVEPEALNLIARQSTGSLRDAISMLDQLSSLEGTLTLSTAQVILGTVTSQVVYDVTQAVLSGDTKMGIASIHAALDGGSDPRQIARQIVDYLRTLLLIKMGSSQFSDLSQEINAAMHTHAGSFSRERLIQTIKAFNQAASEPKSSWHPALALELALADSIETPYEKVTQTETKTREAAPGKTAAALPSEIIAAAMNTQGKKTTIPAQVVPQPAAAEKKSPPPIPAQAPVNEAKQDRQPGDGQAIELQQIKEHWREIRAFVKERSKHAEALLNSSKLVTVKNGTLYLGFSTEVLRSNMNTERNTDLVHQAIQQILQADIKLVCILTNTDMVGLPPELGLEEDGIVGTALTLGGKIVKHE